jgi:5-(carboxyamino)imidazole ribonucleotide synthase
LNTEIEAIPAGAVIGILGGGQLGRMLATAASALGFRTHIFCPEADGPAAQVSDLETVAAYEDEAALTKFAQSIDVATYEFENIPLRTAEIVAALCPLRPGVRSLEMTQDRLIEKNFVRDAGATTANFADIVNVEDCAAALEQIGAPGILKTRRFGYDGKGQLEIKSCASAADVEKAFADLGRVPLILEQKISFVCEISAVIGRALDGRMAIFDMVRNVHQNGILYTSTVPANVDRVVIASAQDVTTKIAAALDHVGVLAVEFFVTEEQSVLVNEIAPRVHNSGHWTIDACDTDQFAQHIRALTGMLLGDPARHADAVMTNLIGDDVADAATLQEMADTNVHLYGKSETRPGRKMGHVTRVSPLSK